MGSEMCIRDRARTSVGNDGRWSVRTTEPLSTGPHVFSVKQRHIDTTEAWAPDVRVNVDGSFVEKVKISNPASNSSVRVGTWIEGTGMPGVELRLVKVGSEVTIYAQGMVGADGRWRVQFKSDFGPGTYSCGAAFYVDGAKVSDWLPTAYVLTFIARG